MSEHGLSRDEVRLFHDRGFLGPYTMLTPEQMHPVRAQMDEVVYGSQTSPHTNSATKTRHLDSRAVYDLCVHPAVVDRVEGILGPNLVLWQSNFFNKEPNTDAYPWHQDSNFWSKAIEPPINVSAWLAIDDADERNSCVQLVAESHKRVYPHIPTDEFDRSFRQEVDPAAAEITPENTVSMEMRAGQFFLFNERMLHRSSANVSNRRRLGLAIRITTPITRCYKNHPVILIRGEDQMGFNHLGDPPPDTAQSQDRS